MFVAKSCFEKFCHNEAMINNPKELVAGPNDASIVSLYATMRRLLGFITADLHNCTLRDLEDAQCLSRADLASAGHSC